MKVLKIQDPLISLILISSVLFGCSFAALGQKVQENFLPGTDFSRYKTYRWVKIEQLEYPAPDVDQKIRRSIDAILESRGFARVEEGESDLLAIYQAALTQERQWNAYRGGDGYWDYGGWYGWGGGRPRARTLINIGTLNLDFYDVGQKKQVWRGAATKTLNPPDNPMKLQKKINKAMAKLLKNFPPKVEN